jgi:NitT/TauT family transport system substrate-binding protein
MKRPRSLLALTVLAAAALLPVQGALAQGKKLDPVALRLSWIASGQFAMYVYGIKKGIYEREGIELTVKEGNGSGPIINSIGAGTDRFADVDANATAALIEKGMPVKILGAFVQTTPASIIFFADRPLKGPRDLIGKKIAYTAGDANHQFFKPMLAVNQIQESQVQQVLLDPQSRPIALINGQVDAMGGYYTQDAYLIEQAAKRKVSYFRLADHGVNIISRVIIVNTRYLTAADRDLNCRMMRATIRAWDEAARNPDEATRLLLEMYPKAGSFEYNKTALVNMVALRDTPRTKGKTWGWIAREDWSDLLAFRKTYASATAIKPHEDYYTNDLLDCRG